MSSIIHNAPSGPKHDQTTLDLGQPVGATDDIVIVPGPEQPTETAPPEVVTGYQSPVAQFSHLQGSSLRRQLVAGDVVALVGAWGIEAAANVKSPLSSIDACSLVAVVVTLAVMYRAGLYRSRVCALRSLEAVRVATASIFGTAAFIGLGALTRPVDVTGPIEAGLAAMLAILLLRWRFSRWLKLRRSSSKFLRTVLLVGTNEDAGCLWTLISEEPQLGYRVGGIAGPVDPSSPWRDLPSTEDLGDLDNLAKQTGANGIIIVASAFNMAERSKAVERALAAGLHVQIWPGLYGLSSRRTRLVPLSGVPLLYIEPRDVASKWQIAVKRGMDLVLASVMLVLGLPVMGIAALAIKLTDKGPVLHRSQRVGRFGQTIIVFKLRTMVPDADRMDEEIAKLNERKGGPLFKATHDPRVTKIGRVLRATSIDEVPQLWNVLNGTMSMVGPRPALLHEVEHFDDELRRRHEMRPGITGLWQVEARDNPAFSAYRRLDLSYVDDWSLGLDVAILASTVHELLVRAARALAPQRHIVTAPAPVLQEQLVEP